MQRQVVAENQGGLNGTIPNSFECAGNVADSLSQDSCLLVGGKGENLVAPIIRYKEVVFCCFKVVVCLPSYFASGSPLPRRVTIRVPGETPMTKPFSSTFVMAFEVNWLLCRALPSLLKWSWVMRGLFA